MHRRELRLLMQAVRAAKAITVCVIVAVWIAHGEYNEFLIGTAMDIDVKRCEINTDFMGNYL